MFVFFNRNGMQSRYATNPVGILRSIDTCTNIVNTEEGCKLHEKENLKNDKCIVYE